MHLAPYLVLLPLTTWKRSSKLFQVSEVCAQVLRLRTCARLIDGGLVLCPDPCCGDGVAVAVGVVVGVTVGVAVGITVLVVLLGVAIPTPSSPSTAPKAPKRSMVLRSSLSSPRGPLLRPARYSSASMEVRSTCTELPPLRCLARGGRNRGGLDAISRYRVSTGDLYNSTRHLG
jgi:hypothetical protein